MKAASSNYVIKSLSALTIIVFSHQANAACSRDDVNFYLEKGFTTDQITALCSEAPAPTAVQTDSQPPPAAAPAMDDNTLFLTRAIKAQKIDLNSESLQYTMKTCIEYGDEDLFGFTPKVCPDVTYIISLKGLEVQDAGKKYGFYGTPEIHVKSIIKRKIIGDLKDQKAEDRELILAKFEKGDKTAIPIREDFSLEEVKQVLQELSN
jgi:hypothetical protein